MAQASTSMLVFDSGPAASVYTHEANADQLFEAPFVAFGDDLSYDLPLDHMAAVLGVDVPVPELDIASTSGSVSSPAAAPYVSAESCASAVV